MRRIFGGNILVLGQSGLTADTSFLLSPAASLIKSGQISSSAGEDSIKTRVSNKGSRRFHSHKKASTRAFSWLKAATSLLVRKDGQQQVGLHRFLKL